MDIDFVDDSNEINDEEPPPLLKCGVNRSTSVVNNDELETYIGCKECDDYAEIAAVASQRIQFPTNHDILRSPNILIGDTAATVHIVKYPIGMSKLEPAEGNAGVRMGNDAVEQPKDVGQLAGMVCNKFGNQLNRVTIQDVTVISSAGYNLFSISKMLKQGWKLTGDEELLEITKGENKLVFDIRVQTPRGVLFALYLKRDVTDKYCSAVTDAGIVMLVAEAHAKLGHVGIECTRKTAKALKWTLMRRGWTACPGCALAKAKQEKLT